MTLPGPVHASRRTKAAHGTRDNDEEEGSTQQNGYHRGGKTSSPCIQNEMPASGESLRDRQRRQ